MGAVGRRGDGVVSSSAQVLTPSPNGPSVGPLRRRAGKDVVVRVKEVGNGVVGDVGVADMIELDGDLDERVLDVDRDLVTRLVVLDRLKAHAVVREGIVC